MGGESNAPSTAEAASALAWWLEAGVDVAVQEAPRDWLRAAAVASQTALTPPQVPSDSIDAMPETLDLFRDWLGSAPSLPFAAAGARRVLPRGSENAPIMLIAEMPGLDDAADGQPIGGEAWALTQRMLAAIGIDADEAYCASLSCFHSPAAKMSPAEIDACAAIARRHLALAKPKRLLLLGDVPARALVGRPLAAARGHVHQVEGVCTVATFHPRMLLENSTRKADAWRDLLLLMEEQA